MIHGSASWRHTPRQTSSSPLNGQEHCSQGLSVSPSTETVAGNSRGPALQRFADADATRYSMWCVCMQHWVTLCVYIRMYNIPAVCGVFQATSAAAVGHSLLEKREGGNNFTIIALISIWSLNEQFCEVRCREVSFPCVSLIACQVPHNAHCMFYLVSVAPLAWYFTPTQENCIAIHPQMMKVSGEWQIKRICMVICDNVRICLMSSPSVISARSEPGHQRYACGYVQ